MLKTQRWETYFDCLKGPVYRELVKDFWVHAYVSSGGMIFSKVVRKSICIIEEDISKLIKHDGTGDRCLNMTTNYVKMVENVVANFKDGVDVHHLKSFIMILGFSLRSF